MKNFCFDTICNITQEPQELQRSNCCVSSKVIGLSIINGKSHFEQLATA